MLKFKAVFRVLLMITSSFKLFCGLCLCPLTTLSRAGGARKRGVHLLNLYKEM